MANSIKGEVDFLLGEETVTLSLCLGTLAQLEDDFEAESFEDVLKIFSEERTSAKRVKRFMRSIILGSGYEMTDGRMKALGRVQIDEFLDLTAKLFERSNLFKVSDPTGAEVAAARPLDAPSDGASGSPSA